LSFLALNFFAGGLPAVLEEFVIFGFNWREFFTILSNISPVLSYRKEAGHRTSYIRQPSSTIPSVHWPVIRLIMNLSCATEGGCSKAWSMFSFQDPTSIGSIFLSESQIIFSKYKSL
jgi:hypothetical protein